MDEALQTLLMERLGLPKEPGEGGPEALASALAGPTGDPMTGALMASLLARRSEDVEEDLHSTCQKDLSRAKAVIRQLRDLLEPANELVTYLGEIFGACPKCWGFDARCGVCAGMGRPGWREPVEEDLIAWIGPPLARAGLGVTTLVDQGEMAAVPAPLKGKDL